MTPGARWVVLCDTNGGTLPHEVETIVGEVVKVIPGDHVGIHAHNDTEQAVANSLAAVRAGARQIQGTLNGLGERCGNANLVSIIPTLKLKPEFADRFEIGVSDAQLKSLAHASHTLDEMLNRAPNRHAPYVGESAFATKAGIHASAIMKDPATYEHVSPDSVGNRRKLLVSDQAGRSNVLAELERIGLKVDKDDARITRLLDVVKEREAIGYAYEAADASFELLARRVLGKVPNYFDVEKFDVNVEQRDNAVGQRVTVSLAVVKVKVDGETLISAAEGNGPVNALDLALRKDLGKYQGYINGLELTDYRVRILNGGTEAVTRVLIESQDESGERWTTVGVSPNIIDASFQALMDSIVYKLVRSGAHRREPSMIDHVSIAVRDLDRATRFYEAVLGAIGYAKLEVRPATVGFGKTYPEFWINLRPSMGAGRQRLRLACGAARAHRRTGRRLPCRRARRRRHLRWRAGLATATR